MATTLDRCKNITGEITLDMPWCVVYDVVTTRGIEVKEGEELIDDPLMYRARLVRTMEMNPPYVISAELKPDDYRNIALYVNPDQSIQWPKSKLIEAFHNMMCLSKSENIPPRKYIQSIPIGNPTSSNTTICPVSFMYKWCLKMGGKTRVDMKQEEIRKYCCLLSTPREELTSMAVDLLFKDSKTVASIIVNIRDAGCDPIFNCRVTGDQIQDFFRQDIRSPFPKTACEAVCLMAIRSKMDISYSSAPMVDYYSYMFGGVFKDEAMNSVLRICPEAYSLNNRFNPVFPESVYNINMLRNIITSEYLPRSRLSQAHMYQDMALAYYTDTFHVGARHGIHLHTEIQGEDLNDLPDDEVILYYGSIPNGLYTFTIGEICELLREAGDYILGLRTRLVLSKDAIVRLKKICQEKSIKPNNPSWANLSSTISELESRLMTGKGVVDNFVTYYNSLPDVDKLKVIGIFNSLLDVSLVMRGWDGKLPRMAVNVLPTNYNTKDVEARSNILLSEFNESCIAMGEIARTVLNLPLIIYEGKGYKISDSAVQGYTILERIRIVISGDRGSNIKSCVRLSSNVFLYSISTYMKAIGQKIFDKAEVSFAV